MTDMLRDKKSPVTVGTSRKLDLRRLLRGKPELEHAALSARAAIAAGDLVRELRTESGMSQRDLAERVQTTQAHISELERGLGRNGPTVGLLARICQELDDELVIETKKCRDQREADLITAAQASVTEVAEQLSAEPAPEGLPHVVYAFSALRDREYNPFVKVLTDGLLTGLYMAMKVVPGYGYGKRAIRSDEWAKIEEVVLDEGPDSTSTFDNRRVAELVCSYSQRR